MRKQKPFTRIMRGRKAVYERELPRGPTRHLRYSLDVFDEHDSLVEVLGRLAELAPAQAAYEAAVKKYPGKRICLRQAGRVIRSNNRDR